MAKKSDFMTTAKEDVLFGLNTRFVMQHFRVYKEWANIIIVVHFDMLNNRQSPFQLLQFLETLPVKNTCIIGVPIIQTT